MAGHPWSVAHPAIRDTLAGIARRHGAPQRRAAALGTAEIRRLVATCSDGLTGRQSVDLRQQRRNQSVLLKGRQHSRVEDGAQGNRVKPIRSYPARTEAD
jgi:hypothetical protein